MSWTIALHGGAGAMRNMTREREQAYRQGMQTAIEAGAKSLMCGEDATRAVVIAVRSMEASGSFNAGRGSCLSADGQVEVDAAVMCGTDLSIGAIAAAPGVANGIELAEAVRVHSPHCILGGAGARTFAQEQGLVLEEAIPSPERLRQYRKQLENEGGKGPTRSAEALTRLGGTHDEGDTVGAVAVDTSGGLAVAVSTGGLWLKPVGRVGDSPVPGAGFWAEDGRLASSATGTGEFILRVALCHSARNRCAQGEDLAQAATGALDELSSRFGPGKAGLIAVDPRGNLVFPFHTEGMGRAALWADAERALVAVWPEDGLHQLDAERRDR